MASSRMKADDKRAKILRELIALESNKYCFDCSQRGPTYVNMTIGAYVCTQCSGLLRGLNNPHRVKSVNIATFTPEDMEFLKSRGNDLCRKVWLGLYDRSSSVPEPDPKNSQNLKDFLSKKYDSKRWYVAPSEELYQEARQANQGAFDRVEKAGGRGGARGSIPNNNSSKLIIQQPPRSAANAASTSAPISQKSGAPAMQKIDASAFLAGTSAGTSSVPGPSAAVAASGPGAGTANLLGDLGADPFGASSASSSAFSADFSSAFNANASQAAPTAPGPSPWGVTGQQSTPLMPSIPGQAPSNPAMVPTQGPSGAGLVATSSSDKYAALAELDGLFGTGPPAGSAVSTAGASVFGASQAPPVVNWSGAPGAGGSGGFGGWSGPSTMAGGAGVGWGDTSVASSSSVFGGSVNGVQTAAMASNSPFGVSQGAPAASVSSWSNGNPFGGGPTGAPNKVSAAPGANPFMANPFSGGGVTAGPSVGGSWGAMPQGPTQQSPSGPPAQNGWGMMAQAPAPSHNPFLGLSNQFQPAPAPHQPPLQQQQSAGPFGAVPQNTTNPFL